MLEEINLKVGFGRVTSTGLVFNEKIYTSSSMIKSQWFYYAAHNGVWEVPILFLAEDSNYILLFDNNRAEIASSVTNEVKLSDETLQIYYEALNNLKKQLKDKKR
ncbi:MAG: hypothetical protein ACE3L7_02030 [Candidatus Pristimantibacillus sp.]